MDDACTLSSSSTSTLADAVDVTSSSTASANHPPTKRSRANTEKRRMRRDRIKRKRNPTARIRQLNDAIRKESRNEKQLSCLLFITRTCRGHTGKGGGGSFTRGKNR